jgi:peptidase E
MNNQKPIYLMAGGRRSGGSFFTSIARDIFKETGKTSPVIAYVGSASNDNKIFYKMISSIIKKGGPCQIVHAVTCGKKADINKAKDILKSADAIFISGGDVEEGMSVLQEKNMSDFLMELYKEGKLFFGISAGSIMLAGEWICWIDPDDDSTAELFPCLGLVSFICDTHAEDDDWEELKAALMLKGDRTTGYGIATDTCIKVYPDGKLQTLGGVVFVYINAQGKIQRLPDLKS